MLTFDEAVERVARAMFERKSTAGIPTLSWDAAALTAPGELYRDLARAAIVETQACMNVGILMPDGRSG